MPGTALEHLARGPLALPLAWIAFGALLYFFVVGACLVGRLTLYRRPADAPLITDDGPPLGESLAPGLFDCLRAATGAATPRLAVIFASPVCGPCADLRPHLVPAARRWRGDTRFVVVLETAGLTASHPSMERWRRTGLPTVEDPDGDLTRAAGIRNRPVALLLDASGTVRMKGVVSTGRHLDALVQEWGIAQGERAWKPA